MVGRSFAPAHAPRGQRGVGGKLRCRSRGRSWRRCDSGYRCDRIACCPNGLCRVRVGVHKEIEEVGAVAASLYDFSHCCVVPVHVGLLDVLGAESPVHCVKQSVGGVQA